MFAYYTDEFVLPLPARHRFPMQKYSLLRARVQDSGLVDENTLLPPSAASDEQLALAHSDDYIERATSGRLSRKEVQRIGFPWSSQLIERSRRSVGATIEAAEKALEFGFAANLAGGTHHAFRDCGEGYCVFNDSIVAARVLQGTGKSKCILVLDADVHQGNGTASIARGDSTIITFSIHGAKNFPLRKESSDYDIPLRDGTEDDEFLVLLESGLQTVFRETSPDFVIYLAGADPFSGDTLGRLNLSKKGLATRDLVVYEYCRQKGLPVVVSMAGGYAKDVHDTVAIHYHSICSGAEILLGQKTTLKSVAQ